MAALPLVVTLIPLIPGLITSILNIITAIKNDPATPEEARRQLELLTLRLDQTVEDVKNLKIFDV